MASQSLKRCGKRWSALPSTPAPWFEERPYKWSRRWYDDPPVDTINYDGGRNPEIHVGSGEWQPLEHTPASI